MEGLLLGITQLKQELDSIDEDLHMHILKTMDIESQILRTLEEVKILTEEEEGCQISIISQEDRLLSVALLAEKTHKHLMQEKKELQGVEDTLKQTTSNTKKNRDDFMSFCSLFQKEVENFSADRQHLLLEKNTLHGEIAKLNILIDAAEVSRHSVLQEKTQYYEELTCRNQGLSAQLQESILKNETIMEEIEGHNKNLIELQANNRQMSGEIQENEEAIRQLKDLVMGLQMKLSNLVMDRS